MKLMLFITVFMCSYAQVDTQKILENTNLVSNVSNVGWSFYNGGRPGLEIPNYRNIQTDMISGHNIATNFASGLWLGGKINGAVKTSLAVYDYDYYPGELISEKNYVVDPEIHHVYTKYSNHLKSLFASRIDLRQNIYQDRLFYNRIKEYESSDKEWEEAIRQGAMKTSPSDIYSFAIYHDANDEQRINAGMGSDKMNVQIKQHTFLFQSDDSNSNVENVGDHLGNTVFIKYEIINRNNVPIEDMYIGQWSDHLESRKLYRDPTHRNMTNLAYSLNMAPKSCPAPFATHS